ncbi:MAG: hypothetical protein CVU48_07900 [Candidatus Cloacimonetes bacterium HGW-Cloacimonetes-1]|jgi:serine/threonine-protein kinase|nr:MAG: hypothetical protein CVU48_07900 [Candidatus Cloacimonetes bacterium HGW-Cloacimonetes-1]
MAKEHWTKAGYLLGIGLGIILVVAFVSSQVIYPILLGRAKDVAVPNLVGMNLAQAKRLANQSKVHIVIKDSIWSESVAVEGIIEQRPVEGELVKPDGTVYIVISKGSKVVVIPDVLGFDYQRAYLGLRLAGLRSTVIDSIYSDSYPRNTVAKMSPMSGNKIEKDYRIKLVLSKGSAPAADSLDLYPSY